MSAQEIIQIANELSARGITPSTAMVKARLSHPVPMAEQLNRLEQKVDRLTALLLKQQQD